MKYSQNIIPFGPVVSGVAKLEPQDHLAMDPGPMIRLCAKLGQLEAEEEVLLHLEVLVMRLHQAETSYRACAFDILGDAVEHIENRATLLGLNGLAQVAADVGACAVKNDSAALAAVVARLARIGDRSVCEIWDMDSTPS